MLQLLDQLSRSWSPAFDFDFFDREFSRFFPAFQHSGRAHAHPVNLYLNQDGAKAVLHAPGWRAEWLKLSVEGNKLHLEGVVPDDVEQGSLQFGNFHRVINLPFRVREDSVAASLEDGVLVISLDKREEDKPKRIQVNVA